MSSPSRNVQYHPPRLSEDRLNLPQPHSPTALLREIGNAPLAHCPPWFKASSSRRASSAEMSADHSYASATAASRAAYASTSHWGRACQRALRNASYDQLVIRRVFSQPMRSARPSPLPLVLVDRTAQSVRGRAGENYAAYQCAVTRRYSSAGANPARQLSCVDASQIASFF